VERKACHTVSMIPKLPDEGCWGNYSSHRNAKETWKVYIILETAYHTPKDLLTQNLEVTAPYNTKTMGLALCLFTAASAEGIEKDCSSLSVNIQCFPSSLSRQAECIFVQGTRHNPVPSSCRYFGQHNRTASRCTGCASTEKKGGLWGAAFLLSCWRQRTCIEEPPHTHFSPSTSNLGKACL